MIVFYRFQVFDQSFKEVVDLFDNWERVTGLVNMSNSSDGSDGLDVSHSITMGKKTKKSGEIGLKHFLSIYMFRSLPKNVCNSLGAVLGGGLGVTMATSMKGRPSQ